MKKIKGLNYFINEQGEIFNFQNKKIKTYAGNGGLRVTLNTPRGRSTFSVWKLLVHTFLDFDFSDNNYVILVVDNDITNVNLNNFKIIKKKDVGEPIPDREDYLIDEEGNVFSCKYDRLLKLNPFLDGKGKYFQIGFGDGSKDLVHRLVAKAFIPNPENKPEVDHIDRDTKNNSLSNLRWVNRKDNIAHANIIHSPVRNFSTCSIESFDGTFKKDFKSITEAGRYAEKYLGCKSSMIRKHKKHNGYKIIKKP